MAVEDRILPFIRIHEWPNLSNQPVLKGHADIQGISTKHNEDIVALQVCHNNITVTPSARRPAD
eukprot:7265683-Karenia_brevis.AAC.1